MIKLIPSLFNTILQALDTLAGLRGLEKDDPELLAEFQQITHTIRHERDTTSENSWAPLFKPGRCLFGASLQTYPNITLIGPDFRRLLICILTNVFWQTNGTNFMPYVKPHPLAIGAIPADYRCLRYFFTLVLYSAGVTDTAILLKVNVGISAWAALANFCGIYLTSQWGRRKMFRKYYPKLIRCSCYVYHPSIHAD